MAIKTGNPVAGIHTYFGLASTSGPAGTVDDISDFLDSVEASSDADELDATTFRRPAKNIIAGFTSRSISLGGKWSPEAEVFFAPVEGLDGVKYQYGPAGLEDGMPLISGECAILSYSGAQASVDGITTFTVELRLATKVNGVFPAGAIAATGATSGTPGAFTPAGATPPTNLTTLQSGGVTASPATAWTTGQSVLLGDATSAHWTGSAWAAGLTP